MKATYVMLNVLVAKIFKGKKEQAKFNFNVLLNPIY